MITKSELLLRNFNDVTMTSQAHEKQNLPIWQKNLSAKFGGLEIIMRRKTPEQRAYVAELRAQLESYRARFYAQFNKPDPEAPFEKQPKPGSTKLRRRQHLKLDNFTQAIIREQLKHQQ